MQCSFVEMARKKQQREAEVGDRQPVEQMETLILLNKTQKCLIMIAGFADSAFTCVSPGDWAGWGMAGGPVIG